MAGRFFLLLSMASRQFSRRAEAGLPQGVSLTQCGVLFAVGESTRSIGDVARQVGLSRSAMTELAKRMERSGTVDRIADPNDRRGRRIKLTAQGKAVRSDAIAGLKFLNAQMKQDFSDDELEVVERWLRSMAQPEKLDKGSKT